MAAADCGNRAAMHVLPSAAHASLQFPLGSLATNVCGGGGSCGGIGGEGGGSGYPGGQSNEYRGAPATSAK